MLTREWIIGAKTETTQGTLVSLAETDFIHALDLEIGPDADIMERLYGSSSLDRFAPIVGKKWYEAKFKTPLVMPSAVDAAPNIGRFLQACGFTETVNPSTNVTYSPSSTPAANFYGPGKSCSIKGYKDGVLHQLAGCIGTFKLILEAGKMAMFEWDFKGMYQAVTDAAFPTNTPASGDPPVVKSASFLLQTYAAIINKLEIDPGNVVSEKPDVNSANSILGYQITDRNPVGSADPEGVLVATHDFYGKFMSGAQAQSSIVVSNGTRTLTITLPKTQYGRITTGDRGGILTYEVPLMFNRNTGDDWISMVFT